MIVISFILRFCNTVCTYSHANKACCCCCCCCCCICVKSRVFEILLYVSITCKLTGLNAKISTFSGNEKSTRCYNQNTTQNRKQFSSSPKSLLFALGTPPPPPPTAWTATIDNHTYFIANALQNNLFHIRKLHSQYITYQQSTIFFSKQSFKSHLNHKF